MSKTADDGNPLGENKLQIATSAPGIRMPPEGGRPRPIGRMTARRSSSSLMALNSLAVSLTHSLARSVGYVQGSAKRNANVAKQDQGRARQKS